MPRSPREVWEGVGENSPSKYCQNTPDFSAEKPWLDFTSFNAYSFAKAAPRLDIIQSLKCLQTTVSSNFVALLFYLCYFSRGCFLSEILSCTHFVELTIFVDSEWESVCDVELSTHPFCSDVKGSMSQSIIIHDLINISMF